MMKDFLKAYKNKIKSFFNSRVCYNKKEYDYYFLINKKKFFADAIWELQNNLYSKLTAALNEEIGNLNGKNSAEQVALIKSACKEVVKAMAKSMFAILRTKAIGTEIQFQKTIAMLAYNREHIRRRMCDALNSLSIGSVFEEECETRESIIFKATEPTSLQKMLLEDKELNLAPAIKNNIEGLSFKYRQLPVNLDDKLLHTRKYDTRGEKEALFMKQLERCVQDICKCYEMDSFEYFAHKLAFYLKDYNGNLSSALDTLFSQSQDQLMWEGTMLNKVESMVKEILNEKEGFFQKWAQKNLTDWDENSVDTDFEGEAGQIIHNALRGRFNRNRGNGLFASFTPWAWSSIGRLAFITCSVLAVTVITLQYCFGITILPLVSGLVMQQGSNALESGMSFAV